MLKYFLILVFIYIPSFAQTTYYISSSQGNDLNNGKSSGYPWQTLEKLNNSWNQIQPGDKILFKKGDSWHPTSTSKNALIEPKYDISGTPNQYITLGSYGQGELPIISSRYLNNLPAFRADANRYLILQDLEFRGMIVFNAFGSYSGLGTHHIKILRVKIDGYDNGYIVTAGIHFYTDFIEIGPDQYQTNNALNNIEIGYCTIKNTGAAQYNSDAISIYSTGDNWIHHNKIYNCINGEAIDFNSGKNNKIEYNLLSGAQRAGIKYNGQYGPSENVIIRGNLILNSREGGIVAVNLRNSKIYNNTIRVENGSVTAAFGMGIGTGVAYTNFGTTGFDNNLIANNIFVGGPLYFKIAKNIKIKYSNGSEINYSRPDLWENNTFKNNIYYWRNGNPNPIYVRKYISGTSIHFNPNVVGNYSNNQNWTDYYIKATDFPNWNSNSNVDNDITIDPKFIDNIWNNSEDFGNFGLENNSPAWGSGFAISDYVVDFLGNPFSPNISIDRGAIQSSSDITAPPPIFNGNNLFKPATGNYEFNIGSWKSYGTTSFQTSSEYSYTGSKSLKIIYTNNAAGGYLYLNKENDLMENLVAGKNYKLIFWAKTNSGSVNLALRDALGTIPDNQISISSARKYEFDFTATSSSYNYLRFTGLSSGQTVYLDDMQLIDLSNSGDDSSILEPGLGNYESSIGSWEKYGNNIFQTSTEYSKSGSKSLKVSYVNNHAGGYLYLNKDNDLLENLIVGNSYKLSFWGKTSSGSADLAIRNSLIQLENVNISISSIEDYHEIIFTATHPKYNYIRFDGLNPGQSVYIDDLKLVKLNPNKSTNTKILNLNIKSELEGDKFNISFSDADKTFRSIELQMKNSGENQWKTIQATTPSENNFYKFEEKIADYSSLYRLAKNTQDLQTIYSEEIEISQLISSYSLSQNYPNPFNPSTKISFALPFDSNVKVEIFNMLGEVVDVLDDGILSSGAYEKTWNAANLASGIYIVRISAKSLDGNSTFMDSKKMQLLK